MVVAEETAEEAFAPDLAELPPEVAVVLGSGLSSFADELPGAVTIPYGEIQGFPTSGVVGHRGAAVGCVIGGRRALVLADTAPLITWIDCSGSSRRSARQSSDG